MTAPIEEHTDPDLPWPVLVAALPVSLVFGALTACMWLMVPVICGAMCAVAPGRLQRPQSEEDPDS